MHHEVSMDKIRHLHLKTVNILPVQVEHQYCAHFLDYSDQLI